MDNKTASAVKKTNTNLIWTGILLLIVGFVCFFAGRIFLGLRVPDELRPSSSLTEVKKLSSYFPELEGTRGDTDIYFFRGEKEGGTVLVLGGTHPTEPAGHLATVVMLENLKVEQGTVIIVPRANLSASTQNEPGEAFPLYTHYTNSDNEVRRFRFGSRYANPLDSWPDPEVYEHAASGQILSGAEVRNMDRCWPGRKDGMIVEQVCLLCYGTDDY